MTLLLAVLTACATCPPGTVPDRDRAASLLEPLGEHARVCFTADGPSVLIEDTVVLSTALAPAEATARAAHLLHHRGFAPGPDCAADWAEEERAARRVEDAWRARAGLDPLGDTPPPELLDALARRCDAAPGGTP